MKSVYTLTADIHYRLSHCSCKNFTTLCVNFPRPFHGFTMTFQDFPWPMLFSMTIQAWNLVFLNPMTFHDFPGPVVTLINYQTIQVSKQLWTIKQRYQSRRPGKLYSLDDGEVLEQQISLRLANEARDALTNAQLNGRHQLRCRFLQHTNIQHSYISSDLWQYDNTQYIFSHIIHYSLITLHSFQQTESHITAKLIF